MSSQSSPNLRMVCVSHDLLIHDPISQGLISLADKQASLSVHLRSLFVLSVWSKLRTLQEKRRVMILSFVKELAKNGFIGSARGCFFFSQILQ